MTNLSFCQARHCCVAAFTEADKNHDGFLSMEEYVRVFKEHGVNITAEEVALYFASKVGHQSYLQTGYSIKNLNLILSADLSYHHYSQDKDRDGKISYDEFCDRKTKTEIAFEVK